MNIFLQSWWLKVNLNCWLYVASVRVSAAGGFYRGSTVGRFYKDFVATYRVSTIAYKVSAVTCRVSMASCRVSATAYIVCIDAYIILPAAI